jgi:hypothetical protein
MAYLARTCSICDASDEARTQTLWPRQRIRFKILGGGGRPSRALTCSVCDAPDEAPPELHVVLGESACLVREDVRHLKRKDEGRGVRVGEGR